MKDFLQVFVELQSFLNNFSSNFQGIYYLVSLKHFSQNQFRLENMLKNVRTKLKSFSWIFLLQNFRRNTTSLCANFLEKLLKQKHKFYKNLIENLMKKSFDLFMKNLLGNFRESIFLKKFESRIHPNFFKKILNIKTSRFF